MFVQELEDVMEGMSPSYERSQRLHDPEAWLPILTQGACAPQGGPASAPPLAQPQTQQT
jgi:hypothetical protein